MAAHAPLVRFGILVFIASMLMLGVRPTPASADESASTSASQIREEWRLAGLAIEKKDFNTANAHIVELEQLRVRFGLENLEEYSLLLIAESQKELDDGAISEADVLLRAAKRLSPSSPAVLLKSVALTKVLGKESIYSLFLQAVSSLHRSPEKLFAYTGGAIYPLLWALTCAIYVSFVVCFALELGDMLRGATSFLPVRLRGIVAPPVVGVALVVPPLSGPLWCIVAWSMLTLVVLPRRRWLVFVAGAVLVLWASLIPFREALRAWVSEESVLTMLRVSSGALGSGDLHMLERLVSERPDDGVAWFYYAKLLRLHRDFPQATAAMERAESLLGDQPYTKAERGLIEFLSGRTDAALERYEEAARGGLDSPDFLFNLAKAHFDKLDTAMSKDYISKALAVDEERVKLLQERESILDKFKEAKFAVGEVSLPIGIMMQSLFHPQSVREPSDFQAAHLMSGSDPILMGILGFLFIGASLARRVGRAKTRFQMYFEHFKPWEILGGIAKVLPGGAWLRAGYTGRGVFILACFAVSAVPLFGWPEFGTELFEAFQQVQGLYAGVVSFIFLLTLYLGLQVGDED